MTLALEQEVMVLGGESAQKMAHAEVEAWDVHEGCWHHYPPMQQGRHGTGAVLYENYIYTCAGTGQRGGKPNLTTTERLSLEEPEFTSLFNGSDLSGWSVQCRAKDKAKTFWSVDDGSILLNSLDNQDHHYVWLVSDGEYSDFRLRLKFQIYEGMQGNSGLQIRSRYDQDDQGGWLNGPQLDIHPPTPMRAGLLYDETRGNQRWIYPSLEPRNHKLPQDLNTDMVLHYGDDAWNTMEVLAQGTRIRCWVNGILATDFDGSGVLDDEVHQKLNVGMNGHIALQLHSKSELKARFRDIEILELD